MLICDIIISMRKLLSCCIIGPFIIALALAMGLFALKFTVLSSSFHKNNLRKTNFYEQSLKKFPTFIAQALSQSNQPSGGEDKKKAEENAQSALMLTTFAKAIENSVKPDWLQTQTEAVIDGVFGYMRGNNNALNIVIPMAPIKSALGSSLSATLKEQFDKLPTCTAAQLKQGTQSADTQCKPAGVKTSDFDKAFSDPKSNPFTNIPDQYDLGKNLTRNNEGLNTLRTLFRVTNVLFWLSIVITLMTAGLALLIHRKNIGAGLRLIGIPSIVIGAINLVTTLLSYLSTGFIGNRIQNASGFGGEFLTLVSDVITNNVKAILNYSLVVSIFVLAAGIAMVIIASKISRRAAGQTENKTPPPSPQPAKP